ncbi:MAG TPA: MFS transporter [Flavobacteriales bacterium]|nr:MFS transporter [Flavobacteriales bacterium]HMW97275.1 MFS transporter [Flavobacteriales bacterium]HMZ48255.1 MFS transporter [Flavobacteriales bacterium]HNA31796.1 MFS transporter [Flavobacteriales bacterium]HNE80299.1 MFS transporter [Flavobacteriales bacterium]
MIVKGDKKVIRAWTMYDWANSAYSLTITSAVFPAFYVATTMDGPKDLVLERFGVRAAAAYPWSLSVGFLIVALIAPILSGIADHRGNKKSFLKFFCYLGAASCAGLAFFSLDTFWIGLACVALACIGFSGSLVFYDAYLPEIADPADHDRVSARGYTMGYIGSVILLVLNLATVLAWPDESWPARLSFISVGLWWAGWAQIAFARLPQGSRTADDVNVLTNGYKELRKTWIELGRTIRLKRFLLAFFVLNMGIQTVMYLAANFAKQEVKELDATGAEVPISDASLITAILIIQLVAILGAVTFVRLSSRFGNVRALMIGAVVWVLACLFAYSLHWAVEFYLLAGVVGLVMGGSQALARSTYAKFLPDTDDHASYFSFFDVSYYLGTVLGTAAYGAVYAITGDLRHTVIAIACFFILGFCLLWRVPRNERTLPAMR